MTVSSLPDWDAEWLHDNEEQIRAENALWDTAYARHRDKFDALAAAVRAEIAADTTQPCPPSEVKVG